jgi:histidinol-phosphate aminotransferase
MFNLEKITRDNIKKLKPYSSARDEFKGEAKIFLDANENAFGSLSDDYNRYPDPLQLKLKKKISEMRNVLPEQIFLGNGSDEVIDLLFRAFCVPGTDNVILMPPTYGMYTVAANTNDIKTIEIPLTQDFDIDVDAVEKTINGNTKLIFVCSPNNPSGNRVNTENIIRLLNNFQTLVIVDEAYIDYADGESLISLLNDYPNLVVVQTFSKARGMAALRVGIAFTDKEIINVLNKIKPPYNINAYSQEKILEALERKTRFNEMVELVKKQREKLSETLQKLSFVQKVYPSQANFLLVKFKDAKKVYHYLLEKGIVVRDRSNMQACDNSLRITVGTPDENRELIKMLAKLDDNNYLSFDFDDKKAFEQLLKSSTRKAQVKRKTSETDIDVVLDLDNGGEININTGIAFFDHMLEQIARHGGVGLQCKVSGDLGVDEHHTIEDTALALGEAFKQALADKAGLERYGFALPMDDASAQVLLDFGGRPYFVWDAEFKREMLGKMPTEMFKHFFKSFSDAAQCNLHIKAEGENEHHKIEGVFKAFARAIKMAIRKDPFSNYIPSTKGSL